MTKNVPDLQMNTHRHEWMLRDPFNFDGPIFECRCGEKRLEADKPNGTVEEPRTAPPPPSSSPVE